MNVYLIELRTHTTVRTMRIWAPTKFAIYDIMADTAEREWYGIRLSERLIGPLAIQRIS